MTTRDYLKQLRNKDANELGNFLQRERRKLANLRFEDSLSKLKNYKELKKSRRKIAQILTVAREEGSGIRE